MGGTPEEEPGNQGPAVGGQQLLLAAIVCFRSPSFFCFVLNGWQWYEGKIKGTLVSAVCLWWQ